MNLKAGSCDSSTSAAVAYIAIIEQYGQAVMQQHSHLDTSKPSTSIVVAIESNLK